MAYLGMEFPDLYRAAIRNPAAVTYTMDATLDGVPVAGATDLAVTGNITDTSKPGVRWTLNANLAPEVGLYDLLAPSGTRLAVTGHVRLTDRSTVDIPMGVYVIDEETLSEGGGGLSITAPDKWSIIQGARFIQPQASDPGLLVVDQIAALIRGALGAGEPVTVLSASLARVGVQTWEKDRDKAILDMAAGIGARVYFDRAGVATIVDIPTVGDTADWLVDASASGVLTKLDRRRSRTDARNVIIVDSSATKEPAFPTQIVWDTDPGSPTYAGLDPVGDPGSAGPLGIVPEYITTALPLNSDEARNTGEASLARLSGMASQVSLGQVPNPAVDSFDVLDVIPPRERYDRPRTIERHVADTVTHSLTVSDTAQSIEGRSTRVEELT